MGHSAKSELVDVTLYRYHETRMAVLVGEGLDGHKTKVWLPFSQIEVLEHKKDKAGRDLIVVALPRWLFEEKGFTPDD